MKLPFNGKCACGAVRYSVSSEPLGMRICQCRDCQRSSGAGHACVVAVKAASVMLIGEVRFHETVSDRGNRIGRGFCGKCGSPIVNRNSAYPDELFFLAGSLDDPSWFEPDIVFYCGSGQPWDLLDPAIRRCVRLPYESVGVL